MNIEIVKVGYLETNCYILSLNNKVLVIDPGDEIDKIKKVINEREVVGCIITHYHFDHVGAIKYFKNVYDINNLKEGINTIDPFTFEVIYTPGHKEDTITIYFKEKHLMFVGDFIFKDGIGRTDLDGGSTQDMLNSLKKISKYNDDIVVYPGHGDSTKLGLELAKYK